MADGGRRKRSALMAEYVAAMLLDRGLCAAVLRSIGRTDLASAEEMRVKLRIAKAVLNEGDL